MLTKALDVPADVQRTGLDLVPALLGEFQEPVLSRSALKMKLQPAQQVRLLNIVECHELRSLILNYLAPTKAVPPRSDLTLHRVRVCLRCATAARWMRNREAPANSVQLAFLFGFQLRHRPG